MTILIKVTVSPPLHGLFATSGLVNAYELKRSRKALLYVYYVSTTIPCHSVDWDVASWKWCLHKDTICHGPWPFGPSVATDTAFWIWGKTSGTPSKFWAKICTHCRSSSTNQAFWLHIDLNVREAGLGFFFLETTSQLNATFIPGENSRVSGAKRTKGIGVFLNKT